MNRHVIPGDLFDIPGDGIRGSVTEIAHGLSGDPHTVLIEDETDGCAYVISLDKIRPTLATVH